MDEQERFVAKHRGTEFRHGDELFDSLATGRAHLVTPEDASPVPCTHLLKIYRRRAEHLLQFDTPYTRELRGDTLDLCDALTKTSNAHCRIWGFALSPHSDFTVFEGAENGEILGCVFANDERLTPAIEWEKLWRGENPL
jgi:hypothetical protein